MKDPVSMPEGQTYERNAIERAIKDNLISPVTGELMEMESAITNLLLKNSIKKIHLRLQTNEKYKIK